tara:strand:+ start:23 stop:850 length:828 start_codon:yes stop_codon:yes gene_type:complete
MIIDSHQHFWNYNEKRDTWINESMEILKKDFLPHDLEPILKQNKIDGCIAVQADQSEEETEFLLKCASENKFIKGVVGWVDLCSENVESRLSHFSNNPIFKGVRHIVQAENSNYLRKKDVEKGIGKLSKFNLTYDLLITTEQIKSAISLVEKLPNQKFIIDHIAKPKISEPIENDWLSGIIKLSKKKNVWCKLSGLVTETNGYNFEEGDFNPFIKVIFENFGPDRILFGSDWPVCLLASNYKNVLGIIINYFKDYDPEVNKKIFGGNAKIFYNLF